MLSSLIASKAARLMTLCICPVVGTGTMVMTVPKVKQAVHNATAPRQYALPKTRERMPAAEPLSISAPPCPTIEGLGIQTGILEGIPGGPTTFGPPGGGGPGGPGGGIVVPPPPGTVPEPQSWAQLVAGFALIGGALRLVRRRPTEDEDALLARVDDLKKQG